jgi:hypothetical protein
LSTEEPSHRGLYRLLSNLVGRYVEAFDEEPLCLYRSRTAPTIDC